MTDAEKTAPPATPDEDFGKRVEALLKQLKSLRNFGGRYGRQQFWLGALGLLGLLIFTLMAASVLMNPTGAGGGELALIFLFAVPFLWLYCKLIIHRLHDLGWSGWWFLVLGPLLIPLPVWMMNETHAVYHRIEQSHAAQQAIKPYVASLQYGALLLFVGGFVLMGCLRGTKGRTAMAPIRCPKHKATPLHRPDFAGWRLPLYRHSAAR